MPEAKAVSDSDMTAATKKLVDGIRKPFDSYAKSWIAARETASQLAPKFMKAYNAWAGDTGGNFIAFVRMLDPTVPLDSEARKSHKRFNAATYLRRLMTNPGGARSKPVRSRLNDLARTIKTLLPLVSDEKAFWLAISSELGLKPRQVTNLQKEVLAVAPLLQLRGIKPQPVHVVHQVAQVPANVTTAAEAAAQGRKRAA